MRVPETNGEWVGGKQSLSFYWLKYECDRDTKASFTCPNIPSHNRTPVIKYQYIFQIISESFSMFPFIFLLLLLHHSNFSPRLFPFSQKSLSVFHPSTSECQSNCIFGFILSIANATKRNKFAAHKRQQWDIEVKRMGFGMFLSHFKGLQEVAPLHYQSNKRKWS